MKNKKLLLVATAAMGVLALGTAGVGTAAWYKASGAELAVGTKTISAITQHTVDAGESQVDVNISATDSDADKLFLTTPVAVEDDESTTIALAAGEGAYYAGTVDYAHMHKITADTDHRAGINLTIAVSPHTGFNAVDGTYYLHLSVASPARLAVTASGSGFGQYVGNSNLTLYVPFTVSSGTFSTVTKYAALSVTGTKAVDESAIQVVAGNWSFTVDNAAGSDTAAAAAAVISRA